MGQARDRSFASGGCRLRYRDEGAGEAVVFLHGWTLDLEAWDPQAAAIAPRFRVLRLDRRGFGHSQGDPSLAADRQDLLALLDGLGIGRATIVGASQGARVALAFAIAWPGRTRALVLDGPPDETGEAPGDGEDLSFDEFRSLARVQGLDAFRAAWRRHPLMQLHGADPRAQAALDRMLARYPGRDLLGAAPPRVAVAGTALLARLAVPALVVNGERDTPVRLRSGERLASTLPDARRIVLPKAGHLPNLDDRDGYNDALLDFFRLGRRRAA